jgi:hypothetical protein
MDFLKTDEIYVEWISYAKKIVFEKLLDWKRHPSVTYMLEHESIDRAILYLKLIQAERILPTTVISDLCRLNDNIGNADKKYIAGIIASPSSLRYIKHSYELLQLLHKNGKKNAKIIEIGGGYGGLALITILMSKYFDISIDEYIIYDLPAIQDLQKYYLANYPEVAAKIKYGQNSCSDLDNSSKYFVVSNYCISAICVSYRQEYLKNLENKVSGVYIHWNSSEFTYLPPEWNIQPEHPNTNPHFENKLITYFA